MKITYCAYDRPGYVGGPNAGLIRLLPELKARGMEVTCLFLVFGERHECPTVCALESRGIPCRITRYHETTELRLHWLLAQLEQAPPDVFIPNLMPAAYFASNWCRKAGIPSIGVLRNVDAFHEGFLEEFAAGNPNFRQTAFVGVSAQAVEMIRETGIPFAAVEQIPSPVEIPPASVRYQGGEFRILYSGRMVERQKRATLTARSLCKLSEANEGVFCTMYGHGPDFAKVEEVVANQGFPPGLRLAGRVPSTEMPNELMRHHCIVLFSEYEGLPLAMMEAMAAGLVPIGYRGCHGIEELIVHEQTGLLLDNPEKELPAAVHRLRDDPEFHAFLSRNARKKIKNLAALERVADKWISLFERTKGSEGPQKPLSNPLQLSLPPVNRKLACEDDRATVKQRVQALTRVRSLDFIHGASTPFLAPRCVPSQLDIYIVRRAILKVLNQNLEHFQGQVIDIGAGKAPYRQIILKAPRVTSYATLDLPGNQYASPDIAWDGVTMPLADNSAETVLATEVLEHCPEPQRFLTETQRILSPGGSCLLTVPFLWPPHDVPHDYWRFTPWSLRTILHEAGFKDIRITALGGPDAALAQMIGLWVRRRSRSSFYLRYIRPLLSLTATPLVRLLAALDRPVLEFHEGVMVTGLGVLARKGEKS